MGEQQMTVADLMGILQRYDPPKDTPLRALVMDESSPTGEGEVAVTNVTFAISAMPDEDGTGDKLVFDTGG